MRPSDRGGAQARPPSTGIVPYGARPSRIRSAPITPAYPTSMTVRGCSMSSPTRKPTRKSVTAARSQTGQPRLRRSCPRAGAEADPRCAQEQVDERRHRECRAFEDLAAVEEEERDAEGEQRQEVERAHRQRPPQVDEPEEEHGREAEPDRPGGEEPPTERPRAPSRHLPRDLRAGRRLGHLPVGVVHDPLRDLARLPGPDAHRPGALRLVERRIGRRIGGDSARSTPTTFGLLRGTHPGTACSVRRGSPGSGSKGRPPSESAVVGGGAAAAAPGERQRQEDGDERPRAGQRARHGATVAGGGTTRACCRRS